MKRNDSGRRSASFQSFDRPLRSRWMGRKKLAIVLAAFAWGLPAAAIAEQPCDVYIPSCGAGLCDCGQCGTADLGSGSRDSLACGCGTTHRKTGLMNNPLYRTLDTVAGGIEHVLGLDRCGNSRCDAGQCDVAPWSSISPMMEGAVEYAAPVMPKTDGAREVKPRLPKVPSMQDLPDAPEVRRNAEDATPQRLPAPQPQSERSEAASPKPIQPRPVRPKAPEMSPPRIVPSQPRQPELLPEPQPSKPQPSKPQPSEPRLKPIEPKPELILPEEEPKKESPFDALEDLNDPFSDDAARLRLPYDPARPASSRTPGGRASGGRASGGRTDADRPVTSGPIGSGLRTVNHEELMRLKPLGAPAGLRPLGGGKTLAPYRVSRQR